MLAQSSFNHSEYVGIPFKSRGRCRDGIDCWGLVKLVYRDILGIELRDYAIDAHDVLTVSNAVQEHEGWADTNDPKLFDLAVMSLCRKRIANHVGIYLGNSRVLHITDLGNSLCSRIDIGPWKSRLIGYITLKKKD